MPLKQTGGTPLIAMTLQHAICKLTGFIPSRCIPKIPGLLGALAPLVLHRLFSREAVWPLCRGREADARAAPVLLRTAHLTDLEELAVHIFRRAFNSNAALSSSSRGGKLAD